MAGWNLPDGVTGNEPQIAGYPEREMTVECGAEEWTVRKISGYGEHLLDSALTAFAENRLDTARYLLLSAKAEIETIDVETPCPFEGDAIVYGADGIWTWTCPLCDTDHEID